MLDIEKIRDLVEMMVSHDLVEISLRDGQEEISLRRPNASAPPSSIPIAAPHPYFMPAAGAPPPASSHSPAEQPPRPAAEVDADIIEIRSPMVGTFYAAADPDSPPFVQVGSTVQIGSVLCILEAMKVFNEIKSEVAGRVERVLVKNAQAVEYGQPLFRIKPL